MPLYTVTTQAGVLSSEAKAKLALELTRRTGYISSFRIMSIWGRPLTAEVSVA